MTVDFDVMQDLLDATGMSALEEAIYRHLITTPFCSEGELTAEMGVPGGKTASALRSLLRRGMAVRVPGPAQRYAAAPPDTVLAPVLARQEAQLRAARETLAELADDYRAATSRRATQLVEVVTGETAIAGRFRQLQAQAGSELLFLVKQPYVVPNAENDAELDLLARGVVVRSMYDRESLGDPDMLGAVRRYVDAGEQARVAHRLPAKLCIVDRQAALLPLVVTAGRQACALLVRPSALMDTLVDLFETLWAAGMPMPGPSRSPVSRDQVSREDREILTLMFAGLTDHAIARQLGTSQRTVQRHIRGLMDRLGASGRFHLGAVAQERGLLNR